MTPTIPSPAPPLGARPRARSAGPRWLLAAALAATAVAQAAPGHLAQADRGQLLYDTHCVACHTTQMHWRDRRVVRDWAGLRAQVAQWQSRAALNWSDEDIQAVAHHLNDRIYRLPVPQRQAALGPAR